VRLQWLFHILVEQEDHVDWLLEFCKQVYRVLSPTGNFVLRSHEEIASQSSKGLHYLAASAFRFIDKPQAPKDAPLEALNAVVLLCLG
jgi:hypothetical protein